MSSSPGVADYRHTALLVANIVVCASSLASALAPNLACFAAFWVLTGSTTPFFLVAGQTIITDVFEPTIRGTATGCFLGTSVVANTISPMSGAIIATYTSWRVIYGVIAGMSFFGIVLCFLLVPKTRELQGTTVRASEEPEKARLGMRDAISAFSPAAVFRQLRYPRVLFGHIACGLLGFNMYTLLGTVRRIINPRFKLTSPLASGLFYLAPGGGFILGSTIGGIASDYVVRLYIRKRDGRRIPQDRLRTSLPAMLLVMPFGTLLYGWAIQQELGGMALPAAASFCQGFGLMAAFSSLNTYAGEVLPKQKAAVISSKYLFQYAFAAGSLGSVGPMLNSVEVGWTFTISAAAVIVGGLLLLAIIADPELQMTWLGKDKKKHLRGPADE